MIETLIVAGAGYWAIWCVRPYLVPVLDRMWKNILKNTEF